MGRLAGETGFQPNSEKDAGRRLEIQRLSVSPVPAEGDDEALIFVLKSDTALQHLALGQVPPRLAENRPVAEHRYRGVQADLLLLADRGIGSGLRQFHIGKVDRRP